MIFKDFKMPQENFYQKRDFCTRHKKEFHKELVLKYKNVVENKKTDDTTLQEKQKEWEEIERKFKSIPDHNMVSLSLIHI